MVAAGQPDPPLDVGRPQHLGGDHRVGDIGTIPRDRPQRELADLGPPGLPGTLFELIGNILREDAHGVGPRGRHARVVRGLEIELGPEPGREPAVAGGLR